MPDENATPSAEEMTLFRWVKKAAPYLLSAMVAAIGTAATLGMTAQAERDRLNAVETEIKEHRIPDSPSAHPLIRQRISIIEIQQIQAKADRDDAKEQRRRMERKIDAMLVRFGMRSKLNELDDP